MCIALSGSAGEIDTVKDRDIEKVRMRDNKKDRKRYAKRQRMRERVRSRDWTQVYFCSHPRI